MDEAKKRDYMRMWMAMCSTEDLEAIREEIPKFLDARLKERVKFTTFKFEPPDDRSMGRLEFKTKVKQGTLIVSANLGEKYLDDVELSFNGNPNHCVLEHLDLPSFHSDQNTDAAQRECAKAVLSFESELSARGL